MHGIGRTLATYPALKSHAVMAVPITILNHPMGENWCRKMKDTNHRTLTSAEMNAAEKPITSNVVLSPATSPELR